MLTPQNDEERKALRMICAGFPGDMDIVDSDDLAGFVRCLAEARAIVREEQGTNHPPVEMDPRAFELEKVRDDITRTAAVVQALNSDIATYAPGNLPPEVTSENTRQVSRLCKLLARERELTAKKEGGDRG